MKNIKSKWHISIKQNGDEYVGFIVINKCEKITKTSKRVIDCDGIEIQFDEDIISIEKAEEKGEKE